MKPIKIPEDDISQIASSPVVEFDYKDQEAAHSVAHEVYMSWSQYNSMICQIMITAFNELTV